MVNKVLSAVGRYVVPVLAGVALLYGVESNGLSKVYQDMGNEKAKVAWKYWDFTGGVGHAVRGYGARGLIDLAALAAPVVITNQVVRRRKNQTQAENKEQ
jgi:hypothetical protein